MCEKTPQVQLEFAFVEAVAPEMCEDCGRRPVEYEGPCPFAQEIHEEYVEISVCSECHYERMMEI